MNSRERTFLALQHKPTDRIPIDFWATSSVIKKIENHFDYTYNQFLDEHDVDLRYIEGPAYIGPTLAPGTDIWGVERKEISAGKDGQSESYSEVFDPPLMHAEKPEDIENYDHWPHPDMFDYSVIEQQCDEILSGNRIVVFQGDRLNRVAQLKPAMYLRGAENIFVDFLIKPEIAQAIFNKIKQFYLGYLERILECSNGKIDIIMTGDDFGAQNGLLLSADMWRTFLRPGFAEYLDLIKNYNTISMHHSCGSVIDIIPDMIKCKLDILQSVQPEADGMSLKNLKLKFGEKICYQGGISIQKTMPFGSKQEIEREVKSIAKKVGSDGGYIFCTSHNIQADTSIENILTLLKSYGEYGQII
jgi:uroporphyrinogen decarboxylase